MKAKMYIRAYNHAFDCDPTDNEARWLIESHSHTYTYGSFFGLLTSEHQWIKRNTKIVRLLRSEINFFCVDQETLAIISLFIDEWVLDNLFTRVSPSSNLGGCLLKTEKGCVMGM